MIILCLAYYFIYRYTYEEDNSFIHCSRGTTFPALRIFIPEK